MFSLIVEYILTFDLGTNLVREGKIKSPNFKQTKCFQLLTVLIQIDKFILWLNFKQFHQTLFSDSLFMVGIAYYFYNQTSQFLFFQTFYSFTLASYR